MVIGFQNRESLWNIVNKYACRIKIADSEDVCSRQIFSKRSMVLTSAEQRDEIAILFS